tara:strand:+ start:263 stop:526 length:264 start_codon:yes stop_codon:yes gene_type:complete
MLNKVVSRLFYSEPGRIFLSILLGLGIASLFRKICTSNNCYNFTGPEQKDLKNKIFSFDSNNDKCFKVNEEITHCNKNTNSKILNFA